jgi:signal transduction histidine kinase
MPWLERLAAKNPKPRLGSPGAYILAALFIAVAGGARIAVDGWLVGVPFLTFFPAIFAAAYFGGFGPGLLAVALAVLFSWFILIPPYDSLLFASASGALALILFVCTSVAFCITIHGFHVAVSRLRDAREREHEFAQLLEQRVADQTSELREKTEELDAANQRLRAEMAERERAEAVARQAQKLEAVGQLTGGLAHDFNNLLTVIMGNLEIARQRQGKQEPDTERFLGNAMQGAERAAVLTHRLLAFSRQQTLAPAPVDLNALVKGMSELIRRTLGEAIDIEIVLAGGLWRTFCDPHELETALLNLVVNARDAMPDGGKLTIETGNAYLDDEYARLHAEVQVGQYVMIAVTDTGIGMDEETCQRVFEPFFTTKEAGRGTGLGLSMVFGFVKQSGGHIKVYSELGQGSCLKLYFPRLRADLQQSNTVTPAEAPLRGATGCTVLVAEDDNGVRSFIVHSLRELGYGVCEAADGSSALEMVQAEPKLDLLLSDVGLPRMNGRKLAEAAQRLRPGLKVLFMTGYTRNAIVHGGRLDPDVALLPKPFTAAMLARQVIAVLEGRAGRSCPGK